MSDATGPELPSSEGSPHDPSTIGAAVSPENISDAAAAPAAQSSIDATPVSDASSNGANPWGTPPPAPWQTEPTGVAPAVEDFPSPASTFDPARDPAPPPPSFGATPYGAPLAYPPQSPPGPPQPGLSQTWPPQTGPGQPDQSVPGQTGPGLPGQSGSAWAPPPAGGTPGFGPPPPVVYQPHMAVGINSSQYGPLPEWPRRLIAKIIDLAVYMVPAIIFYVVLIGGASAQGYSSSSGGFGLYRGATLGIQLVLMAWPFVFTFANDVLGTVKLGGSLGKKLMGLRYIQTNGQQPDWGTGFKRWAVPAVCLVGTLCCVGQLALLVIAIINLVLIITDPARQSIYDKVAGVIVIDAKINPRPQG